MGESCNARFPGTFYLNILIIKLRLRLNITLVSGFNSDIFENRIGKEVGSRGLIAGKTKDSGYI